MLREIRKGSELLSLGQVSQSVYLLVSGAAYQFDYDREGIEENILGLYTEGDWCFNNSSFVSQKPSVTIIAAYSDMLVREISLHAIHQLIAASPAFFQLGGLLQKGTERLRYLETANSAGEEICAAIGHSAFIAASFSIEDDCFLPQDCTRNIEPAACKKVNYFDFLTFVKCGLQRG
ncbi:Crp/Fnr family transcriptional regulator [Pedobacter sp.]